MASPYSWFALGEIHEGAVRESIMDGEDSLRGPNSSLKLDEGSLSCCLE